MSKLTGKVAIVTGASKGIGAAIARELAAAGAAVVVNYAGSRAGAESVVAQITGAGGKAIAVQADVAKAGDAQRLVAEGVNALRAPERAILLITHYQRLLDYIVPDRIHVLARGRIVAEGGKELALELEAKGYEHIVGQPA